VRKLGWISLLNDAASEMAYPLLPAFLASLGATPLTLGVLEGFAEATASFVKAASGRLSDRGAFKKPLIVLGYLISNVARPFMAFAGGALQVVLLRVIDRLGKGLRGAPRDATIAAVTPAKDRGHAFGFHQGMDHWGAVLGPLLAALVLSVPGMEPRHVFLFTIVPGLICVALTLRIQAPEQTAPARENNPGLEKTRSVPLDHRFWRFLGARSLFALAASSDTFLLLRAQDFGMPLLQVTLLWSAHNAVRAVFSRSGGRRSDRVGRKRSLMSGWVLYALTYAGFAFATSAVAVASLFILYAGFFALTEGAEKAFIADLSTPENRGLAFGLSQATSGILLLIANLLMGFVWKSAGPEAAFGMGSLLSLAATVVLFAAVPEGPGEAAGPPPAF
jgi:MFS family permease